MSSDAIVIQLPPGTLLTIPIEALDSLETAIREHHRLARPTRDLATEIELLLTSGAATVPEIGRAIAARDSRVRQILENDPRFRRCTETPGRSRRARLWSLARRPSAPGRATGTSARNEGQ